MSVVRFDFFRVRSAPEVPSLEIALDTLRAQSAEERQIQLDDKICMMLDDQITIQGVHAYLFSRIRMDELPPVRGLDGQAELLELADDEGLGEDVAIAYDPVLRVVSVHRNRFAMSHSSIFDFVNNRAHGQYSFEPIFDRNVMNKFAQMRVLKKTRIRFAGVQNFDFLDDEELSTNMKVSLTEMAECPYIDITFSVGRKNQALPPWVRKMVSLCATWRGGNNEDISTLEVTGADDDISTSHTIDMIGQRYIYTGEIHRRGRNIDTMQLMRIACASIIARRNELQAV